jgi:hypothetical protein
VQHTYRGEARLPVNLHRTGVNCGRVHKLTAVRSRKSSPLTNNDMPTRAEATRVNESGSNAALVLVRFRDPEKPHPKYFLQPITDCSAQNTTDMAGSDRRGVLAHRVYARASVSIPNNLTFANTVCIQTPVKAHLTHACLLSASRKHSPQIPKLAIYGRQTCKLGGLSQIFLVFRSESGPANPHRNANRQRRASADIAPENSHHCHRKTCVVRFNLLFLRAFSHAPKLRGAPCASQLPDILTQN